MKPHYFDDGKVDADDAFHRMAVSQGYVPSTCLLGGMVVMALVQDGKSPCVGCECDRTKCKGIAK